MKKSVLLYGSLMIVLTACRSERSEIVKESFIHKFGVPISKSDWSRNGNDGQIIQLLTDGVTLKRNYEKGVLHGQTSYTFPNSSIVALIETFDHGELICKKEHYVTGIPRVEEKYKNGKLTDLVRWYEDGTPAAIEHYEEGFLSESEYRTLLNQVEARVENGMGMRLVRNQTGALLCQDTIRDGQMVERINYYPAGEPSVITPYENGLIHGTRLSFSEGGIPMTVESWSHGKQEGPTVVFLRGEKFSEVPYVKGEKHGVEIRFRDGKDLAEEVTWKHGLQHGPRKIILEGKEAKTEWYHEGELVSRTTFERLNVPRNTSR